MLVAFAKVVRDYLPDSTNEQRQKFEVGGWAKHLMNRAFESLKFRISEIEKRELLCTAGSS
jgi:hypothetical protein